MATKKIHDRLLKVYGLEDRPHVNTVGNILDSHGLTKKRKRRTGVHRVRPEQKSRIEYSEARYHVINRGNDRSWIFETEPRATWSDGRPELLR